MARAFRTSGRCLRSCYYLYDGARTKAQIILRSLLKGRIKYFRALAGICRALWKSRAWDVALSRKDLVRFVKGLFYKSKIKISILIHSEVWTKTSLSLEPYLSRYVDYWRAMNFTINANLTNYYLSNHVTRFDTSQETTHFKHFKSLIYSTILRCEI